MMKSIAEITKNMTDWQPPVIPENIAHGDMPGDKVEIGEGHVQKANVIFKELLPMLEEASEKSGTDRTFFRNIPDILMLYELLQIHPWTIHR